jgi:hypothetical protein
MLDYLNFDQTAYIARLTRALQERNENIPRQAHMIQYAVERLKIQRVLSDSLRVSCLDLETLGGGNDVISGISRTPI